MCVCGLLWVGSASKAVASEEAQTPTIEIHLPASRSAAPVQAEISKTVGGVLQALTKELTRLSLGKVFDRIAILGTLNGQPLIGLSDRTLEIGIPYDSRLGRFFDAPRAIAFVKPELRQMAEYLKLPTRIAPPPPWLFLTSMTVSFIPFVGEAYSGLSALSGKDLITQEKMSSLEIGLVMAGLATGVGAGMVARKLYKARVVVFSQLAFDPKGANLLTREGLQLVARGGDEAGRGLAGALRRKTWRFRFKFVDLREIAPAEAAGMVRKELQNGRTVILNAHGDWEGIYLGSSIPGIRGTTAKAINKELLAASEGSMLRNDQLTSVIGQDLGASILDGSCFSATRQAAWKKVVGAGGRTLTMKTLGPGTSDAIVELTPLFIQKKLGRTYEYFYNGYPFATYH